jgi:ornithine carbamoyltransferase
MRHLTCLTDLGEAGLIHVLDATDKWREARRRGSSARPLAGKSIGLVFEKASTRTRISLEVAVAELGGHPVVVTAQGSQIVRGEPIADTARVLSRMVHAITFRTSGEERLREMVEHSAVPVLNALSDTGHPMQLLADLYTVRRIHGRLGGLKFAWIGDGNNMANSWIEAAGLLHLELSLACPPGYEPPASQIDEARALGAKVMLATSPREAAIGAHVISTDVFASMGQETEASRRLQDFAGYRVSRDLVELAAADVAVLHCLPAHRGEEIDADVLDGPRSFVWDQAEARLHSAKAALLWALETDG